MGTFGRFGRGERVINLVLSENPGSLASFQTLTFNALSLHFFKPFSMTNGDMGTWYHGCVIRDAFDVDIEDDEDMDDNDVASDDGSLVP